MNPLVVLRDGRPVRMSQPGNELDAQQQRAALGPWVGIRIDPSPGRLAGASPARLNGAPYGD